MTDTHHDAGPVPVELFDPPPRRRPFAATDILRVIVGVGMVALGTVVARTAQSTVKGIEADLAAVFARMPDAVGSLVLGLAQLLTSVVPTVAFVVLLVRRRWNVAVLLLLTGVLAGLAMTLADIVVINHDLAEVLARLQERDSVHGATYPSSFVVAITIAIVTVAAPWLSRTWRRVLWWGVGLLLVLRLLAVTYPAFDIVLAMGVGTTIGALVLLVFGSPTNEPDASELVAALGKLGIRPRRIERSAAIGMALRYRVIEADGSVVDVVLRTPDERDAALLERMYRGLRFRSSEVDVGYSTIQRRVEHESLVLTLADRHGVRVPKVVRLGATSRGAAFVVLRELPGRSAMPEDLADPGVLRSLWEQVLNLHEAGIAHRRLELQAIHLDDERHVWLGEFDAAQIAPASREFARDIAELLTETAVVVGPEASVAAAVATMGPERVAVSLRMLQPLALPSSTRSRAKAVDDLLDGLRAEVNHATGEPGLELEQLERIKPRTLVVTVGSALAFYSLLPQLTNLSETVSAFGDARFQWILLTLVLSAVTYLFAATAFQGAVAEALPFAPNLRVQVATSFTGLVGPAGAGGWALTARFLQRNGVGGAEAGTSVAVKLIAGFAVHVALLFGFVWWSGQSGFGAFSFPDSQTILLVLSLVLAVLGLLVAIRPARRRLLAPALVIVKRGLGQIGEVFSRPMRVAALFGGSVGISLTYVAAMACAIKTFGGDIGFAQVGTAYLVAVAIASLSPTPGGLGALESALIAGLTGFGLSAGVAISSVLAFRLATFWLPVVPGWLSLGWMQRNGEV